jgi:hypothetical protein
MKKKPQTPQQRHRDHPAEVGPGAGPHAARLWCRQCRKHIQWITQAQADLLKGNKK